MKTFFNSFYEIGFIPLFKINHILFYFLGQYGTFNQILMCVSYNIILFSCILLFIFYYNTYYIVNYLGIFSFIL
jgi:hypothetical protein